MHLVLHEYPATRKDRHSSEVKFLLPFIGPLRTETCALNANRRQSRRFHQERTPVDQQRRQNLYSRLDYRPPCRDRLAV